MFRHKTSPVQITAESVSDIEKVTESKPPLLVATEAATKSSDMVLKELMEKNLKWSQIIYEQNRKINNKLMWAAVASWIRMLVIVIPLALAVWFIAPQVQNIYSAYQQLVSFQAPANIKNVGSIEQVLKLLHLNSAQEEQLKTLLK